jgi:GntR family transcriptional regulator
MDIVLNRRGGVPVRDQITAQLELKIVGGELRAGQKLPSVRSLARRLKVHPNTVLAAYQNLQDAGHLELRAGSGAFVHRSGPSDIREARNLDEMIRLALHAAFQRGYSGPEIRSAVERWMAAAPPDRIVVVDPSREMADVVAHELRGALDVAVSSQTVEDVSRDRTVLSGALVLTLPQFLGKLRALAPGAAVEALNLELSAQDRDVLLGLPTGAIVLVVSHAPAVLALATVLLRSLRGDDLLVEARPLAAAREWRRLVKAADAVFADALCLDALRRTKPRRLREARFVAPTTLDRIRDSLTIVVPRSTSTP